MPKNPFDHIFIIDERDDTHVAAAVSALERIDLAPHLNQPDPAGLATGVGRLLVDLN